MREHAVSVHDVEAVVGQKPKRQVVDERQPRELWLQAVLRDRVECGNQDFGRDVDAVVVAGVEIVDEQPPAAEIAAADVEHPHVGFEVVSAEVIELQLANPQAMTRGWPFGPRRPPRARARCPRA